MAMSLSGAGRGRGKSLVCAVCHEVYRSPRLLPCHHTFCLYCLQTMVRNSGRSFPCPTCRKVTPVPPEGALGFQMNFYITEEELEEQRTAPDIAMCPSHQMEPLIFFCVHCDTAICIRCRLTKHSDHHGTVDLSEVAKRSADYLKRTITRLDKPIRVLKRKSTQAQEHCKAAKLKGDALEQQVKEQHGTLVKRIDSVFKTVLEEVKSSKAAAMKKMTRDGQSVQKELDQLVTLRQRVHLALTQASDADKVSLEKTLREGEGSKAHLRAIMESVPSSALRPGLHSFPGLLTDADIRRALGEPVELSVPFKGPGEVIVEVVQLKRDGFEVHGICQEDAEITIVCMWHSTDDTCLSVYIDDDGRIHDERRINGRYTNKRDKKENDYRSLWKSSHAGKVSFILNSKGCRNKNIQIVHWPTDKTSVYRVETSYEPLVNTSFHVRDTNHAMPVAFDASDTGDVIAVVETAPDEQPFEAREAERTLCLYRKGQEEPFARYQPEDVQFRASDVCFMEEGGEEKLLVADAQNDCVHVLSIQGTTVRFERHLAAGDFHLRRPTALNVDDKGRVWIGCEDGRILRCEKKPPTESDDDDDDNDDDDTEDSESDDKQSVVSSAATVSGSVLRVGNCSSATDASSQVSE